MNPTAFAELLAFVSGLFLLVPVFRANWILGRLKQLRDRLAKSRATFDAEVGPLVESDLQAEAQTWSAMDDGFLKIGAVLFALAGLLKLYLSWVRKSAVLQGKSRKSGSDPDFLTPISPRGSVTQTIVS